MMVRRWRGITPVWRAVSTLVLLISLVAPFPAGASPTLADYAATPLADDCQFTLGFAAIREMINEVERTDKVGSCQENVRFDGAGNATQATDNGVLVWRKGSNWTGFIGGDRTWVNTLDGIQVRLNSDRFGWEAPIDGLASPGQRQLLKQAYQDAIKDAATVSLAKVSTDLMAIVEGDDRIVWRGDPGNRQLLVVTWTSYTGYDSQVGKTVTARETWVDIPWELKTYCSTHVFTDTTLRMEQLHGLPPEGGKNRFIELWVSPRDLFRPSPDPEISDHEAEAAFRDSQFETVSKEHVAWVNNTASKSYLPTGYPWTRLGYTYDWGKTDDHVGLSEFAIRQGAPVQINSVNPGLSYCK